MPKGAAYLFLLVLVALSSPFSVSASAVHQMELQKVNYLLWSDVNHDNDHSLWTLFEALPDLHDAGFRTLYLEFSDYFQKNLDSVLESENLAIDDLNWIPTSQRQAWYSFFTRLRSLGGWNLKAIDFKQKKNYSTTMKKIFKTSLDQITWCGQSLADYSEEQLGEILSGATKILIARSLNDSLSQREFEEFWKPNNKVVIFYGAWHGTKKAIPGLEFRKEELGAFGHHLSKRNDLVFRSVLPIIPEGANTNWYNLFDSLPKNNSGLVSSSVASENSFRILKEWLSSDIWFSTDDCKESFLKQWSTFQDTYDFLWYPPKKKEEL